ncbi:MAG: hypothetical protein AAB772_00935 [Patescibacteria group bacterium]
MSKVLIELKNKDEEKLSRLAIRYGISIEEFINKLIKELSSEIPEESLSEYKNPKKIKNSLKRSLSEYQRGRYFTAL